MHHRRRFEAKPTIRTTKISLTDTWLKMQDLHYRITRNHSPSGGFRISRVSKWPSSAVFLSLWEHIKTRPTVTWWNDSMFIICCLNNLSCSNLARSMTGVTTHIGWWRMLWVHSYAHHKSTQISSLKEEGEDFPLLKVTTREAKVYFRDSPEGVCKLL